MENNPPKPNDYWFFLSYSSADNDENLRTFWKDLANELRKPAVIPASVDEDKIGFRDKKEIDVGANWRNTLSTALQHSRVLLCLYSKAYFNSEYCGKEFAIFRSRVESYVATPPVPAEEPRLIIPILWDLPKRLPESLPQAVQFIQYKYEDFGDLYTRYGLSYLMKIKEPENGIAYNKFVIQLADIIYEQATAHKLKSVLPVPPIENINSAFHVSAAPPVAAAPQVATQLPADAAVPAAKGYDVAWFVYVAGRDADYQNIRKSRESYGKQGGFDWTPYPVEERIGRIATSVASRNKFQPETLLMSRNLIKHLREAEDNNTPVVLIVDPWVMKLPSYTETMSELDRNRLATSVVLIVWNDEDQETSQTADELREILRKTFPRSMDLKEVFRTSISSGKALRREVRGMLKSLSDKIMQNPTPQLPVETTVGSFPQLNVPAENRASETLPAEEAGPGTGQAGEAI
jgi:FxsC-like protein